MDCNSLLVFGVNLVNVSSIYVGSRFLLVDEAMFYQYLVRFLL